MLIMGGREPLNFDQAQAVFDTSGRYRYCLTRTWDTRLPTVNFIMLNPSRADAHRLDPTVTRCVRYAQDWAFGGLIITNLFAWRSPKPDVLETLPDPVGPDNDHFLLEAAGEAGHIVAAWGVNGVLHQRSTAVLRLLADFPLMALGLTRQGQPRHPLYCPASWTAEPYASPR